MFLFVFRYLERFRLKYPLDGNLYKREVLKVLGLDWNSTCNYIYILPSSRKVLHYTSRKLTCTDFYKVKSIYYQKNNSFYITYFMFLKGISPFNINFQQGGGEYKWKHSPPGGWGGEGLGLS